MSGQKCTVHSLDGHLWAGKGQDLRPAGIEVVDDREDRRIDLHSDTVVNLGELNCPGIRGAVLRSKRVRTLMHIVTITHPTEQFDLDVRPRLRTISLP